MQKQCHCGETMTVQLRTVIYEKKIEIGHVPVYCCSGCSASVVYPDVKNDLTELIAGLHPPSSDKLKISFEDVNELAYLIKKASDKEHWNEPLQQIIDDRINELLDMLLLAQSLQDGRWAEQVRNKLRQISSYSQSVNFT
ncbi:hypothetical protein [Paenibacillus sp. J2TS4]|uniref:hypothetical protein n=1 Tax=Paenibacillus sp. J2TS4 TaxID=2807194 RepID=UPI001B2E9698|nr:hypothetical protein [Paenibacillus sp. J2TS4]GIP32894.1 hypothetical protein J2TS4_21040 [Paenibacillus sp. J2TS4]